MVAPVIYAALAILAGCKSMMDSHDDAASFNDVIVPTDTESHTSTDTSPNAKEDSVGLPQDAFVGVDTDIAVLPDKDYTLKGTKTLLGKAPCGGDYGFISDIDRTGDTTGMLSCSDFPKSWVIEFSAAGIGKATEVPQATDQIAVDGNIVFFTGEDTKNYTYGTGTLMGTSMGWKSFPEVTVAGKTFIPSFGKGLWHSAGLAVASSNISFASGSAAYSPGTVLSYTGSNTPPTVIPTDGINPTSVGTVTINGQEQLVVVNSGNYNTPVDPNTPDPTQFSSITIIDPATQKLVSTFSLALRGMGVSGEVSSFGARIVLGSADNSGDVAIVNLETITVTTIHTAVPKSGDAHLISVALFSPDGKRVIIGDYNTGELQQWDVTSDTPVALGAAIVLDTNLSDNAGISDAAWIGGKLYVAVGKEIQVIE